MASGKCLLHMHEDHSISNAIVKAGCGGIYPQFQDWEVRMQGYLGLLVS